MKDYNNLSDDDGNILVKTARNIVTEYLKNGTKPNLEKEFKNKFSCFSHILLSD